MEEGKTVGAVARELDLIASGLANCMKHVRADRTKGKNGLATGEREGLTPSRKENRALRMK